MRQSPGDALAGVVQHAQDAVPFDFKPDDSEHAPFNTLPAVAVCPFVVLVDYRPLIVIEIQ